MRHTQNAFAGTVIIVASLLGVSATPAHAATTEKVALKTPSRGDSDGSTWARMNLTWKDNGSIVIKGNMDDKCPADGWTPRLRFTVFTGDSEVSTSYIYHLRNSCEDGRTFYDREFSNKNTLDKIIVELCEYRESDNKVKQCKRKILDRPGT